MIKCFLDKVPSFQAAFEKYKLPHYLAVEVDKAVADFAIFRHLSRCMGRDFRECGKSIVEPEHKIRFIFTLAG